MIKRSLELYQEGGLESALSGASRFFRNKRRDTLFQFLRLFSDSKEALKKYLKLRQHLQPKQYTKADPFKTIQVDPDQINYHAYNVPTGWGQVVGGQWKRIPFDGVTVHGAPLHESNVLHFVEGVPWEETPVYDARMEAAGSGPRNLASTQEVVEYFGALDEIFESMKENGYLSQSELMKIQGEKTIKRNNDEIDPSLNEIGVNIGRDGDILWSRCGKHRLSFAKILGIDSVPVQVRTRHREWEQLRREISTGNVSLNTIHPDLEDLR